MPYPQRGFPYIFDKRAAQPYVGLNDQAVVDYIMWMAIRSDVYRRRLVSRYLTSELDGLLKANFNTAARQTHWPSFELILLPALQGHGRLTYTKMIYIRAPFTPLDKAGDDSHSRVNPAAARLHPPNNKLPSGVFQ